MAAEAESVRRQVEQMKAFIIEEAKEKAQEVEHKATSEAEAKKQDDVTAAKNRKDADIRQKLDAARMRLRVEHAKQKKGDDDKVLQKRVDAVGDVREAALEKLSGVLQHPEYGQLLQQLTVQGAFVLEGDALVRCRAEDKARINLAQAGERASQLLAEVGRPKSVSLQWDTRPMTDAEARELEYGGVFMTLQGGSKITCDNTVLSRLGTCLEEYAPVLRHSLFLDHKIHAA
eukprot:TRINITY_DN6635_c1_g1_i1.p2 TRINITY_DN6635_c1_g1~~TRINITY_DN6635_c1_g1_i1.p2  ORF type:complete len:231 (+),score=108.47 TRINITY_DN6635_c1_g1_i1:117-809(+)